MSIRVMSRVWDSSTHKGSALLLLLAIADHADDHGENAYPSLAMMAKKIRMGERQTRYMLRKLEKSGELVIHRRGGGRGKRTVYTVAPPGKGAKIAPFSAERRQSDAERGQSSVKKGQPAALTPNEPSKEPSKEPSAQKNGENGARSAREAAAEWLRANPIPETRVRQRRA